MSTRNELIETFEGSRYDCLHCGAYDCARKGIEPHILHRKTQLIHLPTEEYHEQFMGSGWFYLLEDTGEYEGPFRSESLAYRMAERALLDDAIDAAEAIWEDRQLEEVEA